jgi:hypothetical protein
MNKKRYEKPLLKEHGDLKKITSGDGPVNNDSYNDGGHELSS